MLRAGQSTLDPLRGLPGAKLKGQKVKSVKSTLCHKPLLPHSTGCRSAMEDVVVWLALGAYAALEVGFHSLLWYSGDKCKCVGGEAAAETVRERVDRASK